VRRLVVLVVMASNTSCQTSTRDGGAALASLDHFTSDRATWEQRAAEVHHGILEGTGLTTLPPRTPLLPDAHSRRDHDGYTVENVVFQSLPGVYVTGNLYRPVGTGPFPLLLHIHGHFDAEDSLVRALPDNQAAAGQLARMGAIVLAIDLLGYGEFKQLPHDIPFVMALQLWNDISALDYLESLPDGDRSRIAAFGVSGGALQAVLLATIDRRVSTVAPIVMISASYDGDDPDEVGMPIRMTGTNNTEIAATLAPRPQLFISDGSDWTSKFETVDLPYLNKVYSLYGAKVESVFLAKDGHDFGPHKRPPLYSFLAHELGLRELPLTGDPENPEGISPEDLSVMLYFDRDHPRPPDTVTSADAVKRLLYPQQ
jgi:dienelactone hydrolase